MLTSANRKALPKLYATDGNYDAKAQVKFFTPWSGWTWYAFEFDGEDTFFGIVDNGMGEKEYGYFSLSELMSIRGPWGLKIERDRYYTPQSKKQIMERAL